MLKRHITKQILQDLEYFPVVGIVGPRQAGKTTLAKHIIAQFNDTKSIYLDLELNTAGHIPCRNAARNYSKNLKHG